MTTPAINIDAQQYVDGSEVHYKYGAEIFSVPHPDQVHRRFVNVRPESHSNPKSISGWRAPSNWSHHGISTLSYPFTSLKVWFDYTDLSFAIYSDGAGWQGDVPQLQPFPDYLERSAVNRALLKLKQQTVNLATNFAERRQLENLTFDTMNRIVSSIHAFRTNSPSDWRQLLKIANLRKETKHVPQAWLECQYGWNPLLQDVHDAAQSLNKTEGNGDSYRASVKTTGRDVQTWIYIKHAYLPYDGVPYYEVKCSQTSRCLVHLDYVMENPLLANLAQLGLTNPADLVWEELPYSFVIDWFLPIGNYLQAFDADLGWSFKGGSISYDRKASGDAGYVTPGTNTGIEILNVEPFHWEEYIFGRVAYADSPTPEYPSLKNPLKGYTHFSEAMSLLVGAFH